MAGRRIQRKREKGWRKPDNCLNATRPGRYGNPFVVGNSIRVAGLDEPLEITKENCLLLFEIWARQELERNPRMREEMAGKDMMCWCALDQPCHVDIWFKLLREPEPCPNCRSETRSADWETYYICDSCSTLVLNLGENHPRYLRTQGMTILVKQ